MTSITQEDRDREEEDWVLVGLEQKEPGREDRTEWNRTSARAR